MKPQAFNGIFAAAITPLRSDFSPDLSVLPLYLDFLAQRGCHGALLLGTTGEGPSFSPEQRRDVFRAALKVRQEHPEFRLLAGTGTPSLDETSALTRSAFDLGIGTGSIVLGIISQSFSLSFMYFLSGLIVLAGMVWFMNKAEKKGI